MNQLYQRTFDHVTMPEEHAKALREALVSRCSDNETEVYSMNTNKILRRPAAILVAILIIASLAVSAFACGGYVVYQIKNGEIELPENSVIYDWIEFEPDEVLPYDNWTETDGEVTVNFNLEDSEPEK